MAAAVVPVTHHRVSVIEAQRTDRQIKPESDTDIRSHVIETKKPRFAIHETHVVKKCAPRFFYDRKSPFNRRARHRLTANRLAVLILWTDFAERKATEIVRTAEEKPLVNWYLVAAAPLAHRRDFAVDEQDGIPG